MNDILSCSAATSAAGSVNAAASPLEDRERPTFQWTSEKSAAELYLELGDLLASCGGLYRDRRHEGGLVLVEPGGEAREIQNGAQLAPVVVDRVDVCVLRDGKPAGNTIPIRHLTTMLGTEAFLRNFLPIDLIANVPAYLPDYQLAGVGYNDGGEGNRIVYTGRPADVADNTEAIDRFLRAMPFASNADRTNALAAVLTTKFRNLWLGGKPVILATANKSHAGKNTVVDFACGRGEMVAVTYQETDWAFERAIVGGLNCHPGAALVHIDNARLAGRGRGFIRSGFLERILTDARPMLFSTGTGAAKTRANDIVFAITTNDGAVSTDLLNRSLPIHLAAVGDIHGRDSGIGNPRLEYLPQNCERIEAEIHGMVKRWRDAGCPLDEEVKHPFALWARTVGGILKFNGYDDFLANYQLRRTAEDPMRRALGLLGLSRSGQWLTATDWAQQAAEMGLVRTVIPEADRESDRSRARGIGVVLSAHQDETFDAEDDSMHVLLQLQRCRRRFGGKAETRYRFKNLNESELPADDDEAAAVVAAAGGADA